MTWGDRPVHGFISVVPSVMGAWGAQDRGPGCGGASQEALEPGEGESRASDIQWAWGCDRYGGLAFGIFPTPLKLQFEM